jgi:hypothetical protein
LVDDLNNLTNTLVAVGQALTTIISSQPPPAAAASLKESLQSVQKAVISLERSAGLVQMGMQKSAMPGEFNA